MMITVSEAKRIISDSIRPLDPVTLKIGASSDHILAANIYAAYDIPAFQQSSMDGYAVKFDGHRKDWQLIGEMAAGANEEIKIDFGQTVRIFTGAPVPSGADTVVMQEKIIAKNGRIEIHDENLELGKNVRDRGSEIKVGELAMRKGDLLTPAAIGFLAGIGVSEVTVFPKPKISIIVTGKELQSPGLKLSYGQVYESNSYSLGAALKKEGIEDISVAYADDNLEVLTEVLSKALHADVVILTGGVSVGDYDFVKEACKICGVQELFHKVNQKPGKPLYFGKKEQKLVFGLPGNPSSVLSCYYNYVLPSINTLSSKKTNLRELTAEITREYNKSAGLTHFLKGMYADGKATPLNAQESFKLSSFAHANCLICLDEEQTEIKIGELVKVLLLPI